MSAAQRVLIVGGGTAGMSLAICLARSGIDAEIAEVDKEWRTYGAGISLTGPTLRAFQAVGVLEQIKTQGFCVSGLRVCDGRTGQVVRDLPSPPVVGADVPGGGGIMRPVLHKILADAVRASGTRVRLGTTVQALEDDGHGVDVTFTDGTRSRYDIVVGADGLHSQIREYVKPGGPQPEFTGQALFRVTVPRAPEIDRTYFYLRGTEKIGINAGSQSEMYLFLVLSAPGNPRLDEATLHLRLRELLEGYGGVIKDVRDGLNPQSRVLYRPMESLLTEAPWCRGRVLLIGDAAHATTPHLASGAGIGVEDALVLTELLTSHESVAAAFDAFMSRRFERCRLVVHNSRRLGEMEMAGGAPEPFAALMAESMLALAQPI